MKGLFCGGCKARNNEEYKIVLAKRQKRMCVLLIAGLLTVVAGIVYICVNGFEDSYSLGFVFGFGVGLALGAALAMWKIRKTLRNEDKVKEARLKETDEREVEVANQALRLTAKIMLAALYVCLIIGGFFWEEIMLVCCILVSIFLLSYEFAKKYYNKQM